MPTSLSESTALHHEFAMSSMLILPDSFGEIFLGNTFSSYISVINQYACDLRDVGLTVNIQCANDRVDLHDNRYARTGKLPPANPAKVLLAGSSLDMVVDYPLNQIGNHVLRVGVSYVDPISNEQKSLRKFYRFAVQNPLVINFKQSKLLDESLVEAQIRNVSKLPLFIDSIKFLPLLPFTAEEFEASANPAQDAATETDPLLAVYEALKKGPRSLLNPQEELQHVFRIKYDPAGDPATIATQVISPRWLAELGAIARWMEDVGGRSRISPESAGDSESRSYLRGDRYDGQSPEGDHVRRPVRRDHQDREQFCAQPAAAASVSTRGYERHRLPLDFSSGTFMLKQLMGNVGLVDAKSVQEVQVEFLPTVGGLQTIRGAVCVDIRSGMEFTQDALAHVLVHSTSEASRAA
ncbi:hypothetical protein FI667_g16576, partial [Globisporangium splendens]